MNPAEALAGVAARAPADVPTDSPVQASPGRTAMVVEHLLQAIADGRLPPGTELRELRLARQLGVSRAPVREAIQALAREGLVRLRPRRSPVVSELDRAEALDLYEYVAHVQSLSARLVLPASSARVQQMLLAATEAALAALCVPREYRAAELRFFHLLTDACPNHAVREMLRIAWRRAGRYHAVLGPNASVAGSRVLLERLRDAAVRRDGLGAERAVRRLLELAKGAVVECIPEVSSVTLHEVRDDVGVQNERTQRWASSRRLS